MGIIFLLWMISHSNALDRLFGGLIEWKPNSGQGIPEGAIQMTSSTGEQTFVSRVARGSDELPTYTYVSYNNAYIMSTSNTLLSLSSWETLIIHSPGLAVWQEYVSGEDLPPNAVVGGQYADGTLVYIAKAGGFILGDKIFICTGIYNPTNNFAEITFNSQWQIVSAFSILLFVKAFWKTDLYTNKIGCVTAVLDNNSADDVTYDLLDPYSETCINPLPNANSHLMATFSFNMKHNRVIYIQGYDIKCNPLDGIMLSVTQCGGGSCTDTMCHVIPSEILEDSSTKQVSCGYMCQCRALSCEKIVLSISYTGSPQQRLWKVCAVVSI